MNRSKLNYEFIEGKTYTLFGNGDLPFHYYQNIRTIADKILKENSDITTVLEQIHRYSNNKKYLKRIVSKNISIDLIYSLLTTITPQLNIYTQQTVEHLKKFTFKRLWDRRLATTREQYHLYMLEIELTNRLFKEQFLNADRKVALLPYCLQDFSVKCKASPNDFDYQCKHCSMKCYQNFISAILRKHQIEPYIWKDGKIKALAKSTFESGKTFGILGIACVPELAWGMRKCQKYKIPVIGLPLNANRCIRWFGEFFHNSVDLDELEKLVSRI